jgi:hypothetical protein
VVGSYVVTPRRHVTSLQQSREFVTTNNLEAVNYGKNVGSVRLNLIRWGRKRDRGLHSSKPESGPRFLTEEKVAPTSGDLGDGVEIGAVLSWGRERPRFYSSSRLNDMNTWQ